MPARSKLPSWLEHLESDSEYMDTVYCALELRNRARKAMCNKRTAPIHTDLISAMNARVAQSFVQRKRSAFSGEHANRVTNWHRNRYVDLSKRLRSTAPQESAPKVQSRGPPLIPSSVHSCDDTDSQLSCRLMARGSSSLIVRRNWTM